MATLEQSIDAITNSRPPLTDSFAYLTILEAHLRSETVSTLQPILEDQELTQSIGWDLIHILLPIPGSEECLTTIARLGNPREVILKVTEALTLLEQEQKDVDEDDDEDTDTADIEDQALNDDNIEREDPIEAKGKGKAGDDEIESTASIRDATISDKSREDKFSILVGLLAILHPRIKTKYPSRFLSTSLMAVLAAYRPTHEATHAVVNLIQALSAQKRPPLPTRSSSLNSLKLLSLVSTGDVAPDPEASVEDVGERAIQKRLLQSFVTHILEEYVKANNLEWAARLQEHFEPERVVPSRTSVGSLYKDVDDLQQRDICVGQLAARARDLGLSSYKFLLDSLDEVAPPSSSEDSDDETDKSPTSPDQIPLSKQGCLLLVTYSIFSSIFFDTASPLPALKIFPDHANLVSMFIGNDGPTLIGSENEGTIDSVLAIGSWLEHSDKFVSGPLDDKDFVAYLQTISLLSAKSSSPTLRYSAHLLTSKVLRAHPDERVRLSFISDTLQNCPYDNLKGSAVSWLKDEILKARERQNTGIFSTTAAIASVQPFLYPDFRKLEEADLGQIWEEIQITFPFIIAVINFTIFIANDAWNGIVQKGSFETVEELFAEPLRRMCIKLHTAQEDDSLRQILGEEEMEAKINDLHLLEERLATLQGQYRKAAGNS